MGEVTIVLLRSLITFASLLILSRFLGKTQIAQLTFFEWVTGITLGSIAGELTTDLNVRPWPVYAGLVSWVALTSLTQAVVLKSRWISKMVDGEPVVVIQNGQILERNLRLLRMRASELSSLLRVQGVFNYKSVEFAVVEPNGKLSVLKRSQERPVTPADLKLSTEYEGLGLEVVVDGLVMEQNLRRLGVNRAWLRDRLQRQGVTSLEEVFLAVIDTSGHLYVDCYRDRVPPTDDISDYPGPN